MKLVTIYLVFVLVFVVGFCSSSKEEEEEKESLVAMPITMPITGNIRDINDDQNSVELQEIARFAVQEHNKKQNTLLEFDKLVKAKYQVVSGTMYYLTVEVTEGGKKQLYEAKVWDKPWLKFRQLEEFNPVGNTSSITSSDLGAKQGDHAPGWQELPADDPVVKEAADHAVKSMQHRSNSLVPFELLEILLAKAEVIEDFVKFDMLLKLKRGSKEEKFKVEVHKNLEDSFHLNHMQQEHTEN